MSTTAYDVAIIGGGIVGLATGRELARAGVSVALLEAEGGVARHQTGNNSGVIHSGLYYKPGSQKARNCAAGRDAMYRYCSERNIPHENCGKIVVALTTEEIPRLDELERRGRANGLTGMRRIDAAGIRRHEPHATGLEGLWVPETGIVDFGQVARAMAEDLTDAGGEVRTGARVRAVTRAGDEFVLQAGEHTIVARNLINCGGLQCDRIARLCGLRPPLRIIPFRGEYYKLTAEREQLVRNLIYPVPDPSFPFLGVHFTRMVRGGVEAGPNAVLALRREGYGRLSFSARDALGILIWPGFWKMASRHWRTGLGEVHRSFSKSAFVRALRRLMPELADGDLVRHGAGVRAQAVARDGSLLDDFHFLEAERQLHVLNAPSPAATASLAIGATLAERAHATLRLPVAR